MTCTVTADDCKESVVSTNLRITISFNHNYQVKDRELELLRSMIHPFRNKEECQISNNIRDIMREDCQKIMIASTTTTLTMNKKVHSLELLAKPNYHQLNAVSLTQLITKIHRKIWVDTIGIGHTPVQARQIAIFLSTQTAPVSSRKALRAALYATTPANWRVF